MFDVNRLRLLVGTMRYLSPTQMWYRGRRIVRHRWWRVLGQQAPPPGEWVLSDFEPLYTGLAHIKEVDGWPELVAEALEEAYAVARHRFNFLNYEVDLSREPGWHDQSLSRLWRYHLHYFDYVYPLLVWAATEPGHRAYQTFQDLALSWIEHNRQLSGDGWHPYTISLRLVNWLHAVAGFRAELESSAFGQVMLSNLYGQAQMLSADLELDVRGNHLLENLRALIWAGIAFEGTEPLRWLQHGLALLEEETSEQILADGGHFERTPGYHLLVLKNYLEIAVGLRRNRERVPAWLEAALRRMLNYLVATLPPGDKVALVKDTAWDTAPDPHDLLVTGALYFNEAGYKRTETFGLYPLLLWGTAGRRRFKTWPVNEEPRPSVGLKESGYYILRDDARGDYLIFDAGKPCPDYLPAHAHADLLSYELWVNKQRVVVDAGVYEYVAGVWRDYFRSTRAHNTVEVAGQNQSEVWSSFRVARRAKPQLLHWESVDSQTIIQAEHDGYQRLSVPVIHRRTLVWRPGQFWLIVDELGGKGQTVSANHIHFHPALALTRMAEAVWRIDGLTAPLWLTVFGRESVTTRSGQIEPRPQAWYSEEFGQRQPNPVLTLNQPNTLPIRFGYVIAQNDSAHIDPVSTSDDAVLVLIHKERKHTLTLSSRGTPQFR